MNIAFATIGCRTNQAENEMLRAELSRRQGCAIIDDPRNADVVIVNTCSVTSRTEAKVRQMLHGIARRAPQAKILVTGCMVEHRSSELMCCANVFWAVGNAHKQEIPAIILRAPVGRAPAGSLSAGAAAGAIFLDRIGRTALQSSGFFEEPAKGGRTRLHLKIQEGCDRACAYCIVPQLRGPSRSLATDTVANTCRRAIDKGYKEIILTGTHIGQFKGGLLPLIEKILHLEGDFRLRLSSLEPAEMSDELLLLAGEGKKLCDHLHFSLQSLSAEVLMAMNRSNKALDTLVESLADFRGRRPQAGLGADFIVGFPGETDAMFEATVRNAKRIGFSYAHIFRFSQRPGTAAASLPDKISESVKRSRSEQLRAVIENSRKKFVERQRGIVHRIIVEQEQPVRGVTSNYLSVELSAGLSALHNSWLDVVIEGTAGNGKYCRAEIA